MPIIGQISVGDGATFTPSVSSTGELSWSNNKNLENPATLDIPQAVMDRYQIAPINSPAFTGNPTAPTQAKTDNSTKLATTAYVQAVVEDYATLNDLATELEDYATLNDLSTGLAGYLPLSGGTMTGPLVLSDGGTALSDAKVACGSVTNIPATSGAIYGSVVTFPTPFATAPIVTCTMTGMSSGGVDNPSKIQIYTNNVSATGFTVRIYNSGTATYTLAVHWIAVQL